MMPNMELPIAALSGHVRPRELDQQGQQDSRSATLGTPPSQQLCLLLFTTLTATDHRWWRREGPSQGVKILMTPCEKVGLGVDS